jgi:hypothetical protein
MSFVSRFLKGEVTLWKSFWLVSAQPLIVAISVLLYEFFIPRPIYPDAYLYTSIIVRLSCVIFYSLVFLGLVYGTWKSTNNYQGPNFWKWLARLVLIANALMLCIGLFVNSMELAYVDHEYFPRDFKSSTNR